MGSLGERKHEWYMLAKIKTKENDFAHSGPVSVGEKMKRASFNLEQKAKENLQRRIWWCGPLGERQILNSRNQSRRV